MQGKVKMQSTLEVWLQDRLRRVKRNIRIDDSDCDQPQVVLTPGPPLLPQQPLLHQQPLLQQQPLLSDSGLQQVVPSPCPPLLSDSDGSDDSDSDGPISRRARRAAIQASLPPIDLLQHQQLRRFFGATRDGVAATALPPADPCNLWNSIPRRPSQYLDESAVHASDSAGEESATSGSLSAGFISEHDDALPNALQRVEHQQRGTHFNHDMEWIREHLPVTLSRVTRAIKHIAH